MPNLFLIFLGKFVTCINKLFNLGSGSTWPGHIALSLNPHFIKDILHGSSTKIVLIAGTNGKTTTAKMVTTILAQNKQSVFQNTSGANLLNGIASAVITHANISGKIPQDYAVFEVDENTLPLFLKQETPDAIILLDLFRDQLDRYGELDSIAKKWKSALEQLPNETKILLNADDPLIASLVKSGKNVFYFGLEEKTKQKITLQHASDSIYCPRCQNRLEYQQVYYSHLGKWKCPHCGLQRPTPDIVKTYYPLAGTYNKYNALAATLFAKSVSIPDEIITEGLSRVGPAFGRQEKITVDGKQVQLFLSKNPVSFNQSLETIRQLQAKYVLFVLNDRIPDGRDISWIWDVDFEEYMHTFTNIFVSGDRAYDMGLRLFYTNEVKNNKTKSKNNDSKYIIYESLDVAIKNSLGFMQNDETLFILPTYSAMLEVRKILTGKKIL